jgi:hypothetical protein
MMTLLLIAAANIVNNIVLQDEEGKIKEDLHGQRGYDKPEVENNKPQFNRAVYLKEI